VSNGEREWEELIVTRKVRRPVVLHIKSGLIILIGPSPKCRIEFLFFNNHALSLSVFLFKEDQTQEDLAYNFRPKCLFAEL
jgi:hypothetical protein